jgi:hypothetical protein
MWVGVLKGTICLLLYAAALSGCAGDAKPLSEQFGSLSPGRYVTDQFHGVPLWPLLEGHHWCADEGDTSQTIMLKVEDETVIVDVYSESEMFEKILPEAQKVLKTVKWEEV